VSRVGRTLPTIAFALRDVVPGTDFDAVAPPGIGAAIRLHATDVHGPFGRTFTFADPDGSQVTLHDRS
jgi:hypothetical protein